MNKIANQGFTLIELIIVLVLIGILAAVAVPRFANLQDGAEDAAIRGTLGNVRSAITITRAENLANSPGDPTVGGTVTNWWPSAAQLSTPGSVIDGTMPIMTKGIAAPLVNTVTSFAGSPTVRDVDNPVGGWRYNPANGTFYANTDEDTANMW